jgi:hypothetical protein
MERKSGVQYFLPVLLYCTICAEAAPLTDNNSQYILIHICLPTWYNEVDALLVLELCRAEYSAIVAPPFLLPSRESGLTFLPTAASLL